MQFPHLFKLHNFRNLHHILHFRRADYQLAIAISTVAVLMIGCGDQKYTQCEQIIYVASQNAAANQNFDTASQEQPQELKSWLESAHNLEQKAQSIRALSISDGSLIGYQDQLATVYQIYSQATYAAVKARENKNIEALEAARADALEAGTVQQNLIKKINVYCLNN